MPEAPARRKGRSRIAFSILGAVLTAVLVVLLLGKREAVTSVQASSPAPASLPRIVTARGKLEPFRAVKIAPEVSGEIVELAVSEGQRVKKGQLLLRLQPEVYLASRDQAEGNFKSAQANLAIANAHLQTARAELKRNQDLFRSKLLSDSAFDEAQAAYEVALAQKNSAEGQLEAARAGLARAQFDLDRTTLRSPIDGTVAQLHLALGDRVTGSMVSAGAEVMSIADLNAMEARVSVRESDIGSIDRGQKAHLELSAFPGHVFEGTVLDVATSPEALAGTPASGDHKAVEFEVKIRLPDQRVFRPGMSVTARIEEPSSASASPTASTRNSTPGWTS